MGRKDGKAKNGDDKSIQDNYGNWLVALKWDTNRFSLLLRNGE
jgi:hypothetical protein